MNSSMVPMCVHYAAPIGSTRASCLLNGAGGWETISAAGRHNKQLVNVFTCSCLARVALGELAPKADRWLIRHAVRASRLQMLAWGPTREPGSAYDFSGARMRLSRFWRVRGRHLHAGDAAL